MANSEPRFVRACRREPVDRTPVWFMRQAGRYLPEYRRIREQYSLVEICHRPDVAAEVTLQPLRRFDLDAAIIFADLLLPFEPMGAAFEFAAGEGPVIHAPVRSRAAVDALREVDPERDLGFVLDAIRLTREKLDPAVALIGFAGAPFTLASYLIEGGSSKNYIATKTMMHGDRATWHTLLGKLARVSADFLKAQIAAGVQAVQIFDSWVGALSPSDYRELVLPHTHAVFDALAGSGVPRIHFGTGTAMLLEAMRDAGGDVIGADWRISIDEAWSKIGGDAAIQGNLDPVTLFAPDEIIDAKVDDILERIDRRPGHIFNLGHGILPGTPPEAVARVTERVHRRTGG